MNEVHSWKKIYLKTLRLVNYTELCSQVLQGQSKSKTKDTQVTAESQLLSPEVFPVYTKKKKERLQNAQRIGSVRIKEWANLIR